MTKDYLERQFKNYHSITGGVVTPQMFGALADGVHDDSLAIKQAFLQGGNVHFPKGTYLIDWQKVRLPSATDLNITGEGKEDSVIVLKNTHNDGTNGNGLIFIQHDNMQSPNIAISNIGVRYTNDDNNVTYPQDESALVVFDGYFGNIVINNVHLHLSGSANELPKDTLCWLKVNAKSIIVTNSLFENFSNREVGGCLWINPSCYIDGQIVTLTIDSIDINNNIFRNTNKDEAIGIWGLNGDTEFNIHKVSITDNFLVHKNWNGDCFATKNMLSLYNSHLVEPVSGDYLIARNSFYTSNLWESMVKFQQIEGVVIDSNKFVIDGTRNNNSQTSNTSVYRWVVIENNAKVLAKNNVIDFNVDGGNSADIKTSNATENDPSCKVIGLDCKMSDVDYINNVINSMATVIVNDDIASGSSRVSTVSLTGNVINYTGNSLLNLWVRKNVEQCKVNLNGNTINNGGLQMGRCSGTGLSFIDNNFSRNSEVEIYNSDLIWRSNKGVTLKFRDTNYSTKMTKIEYLGKTNGMVFIINSTRKQYSKENKAQFFANADINFFVDSDEPSNIDFTTEMEVV